MSFDTTFDFTPFIAQIQNSITSLNTALTNLSVLQTQLQEIQGYPEIVADQLANIGSETVAINSQLDQCYNSLSVITTIQSLDDTDKLALYTFFGLTSVDAPTFTGKLLGGYQRMLQDPNILSLIADTINSTPLKTIIGNVVIKNY